MSVLELFKVFGTIFIDNDPSNRKLEETDAKAEKVGNTLANTAKTAAKWGAAIASGAAAAGGALFALVNRVTNTASAIDAKRKQLGVTSEALQEYSYAADQVGVAQDSMERALGRLNQRIGLAERGNEKYRKSLDELGVTSRDTSEAFMQAIETLHQMEDADLRAAAASDLFGTQLARQLMPIIEEGGDALLMLRNRAHDLGKVMDQDSTIAANNYQSALADVRGVITGIAQDMVMKVLPTFERWMVWTADNIPKAWAVFQFLGEVVGIVFKYIGLIVGDSIKWMRENAIDPFVNWLINVWQERGPPLIAAVESLWDGVKAVFKAVFGVLTGLWDTFILAFQGDWEGAWERLKQTFVTLWNALPDLFTGILNPLIDLADTIMQAIIDGIRAVFGDEVAGVFETAWDAVKTVFEGARDILLGIWAALTAAFQGDWEGAWTAIQGVIETAWATIQTVIESALSIIDTVINGALSGIVALIRLIFGDEAAGAVDEAFEAIRLTIDTVSQVILGIIRAFAAFFKGDWETAWEEIKTAASTLWNALPTIFETAINGLIGIADTVMQAIIGVVRSVFGDEVAGVFETAWDAVKAVFEGAKEILLGIWTALTAAFQGDWQGAWTAIQDVVQTAWDTIETVVESALSIINTVIDGALTGIVALVRWAFGDEAADAVDSGLDVVRTVVDTVTQTILGVVRVFAALFRGDWEGAWTEVKAVAETIWNALPVVFEQAISLLTGIADTVMTAVIGVIRNLFGDNVADHFQGIWDSVKAIFETVTDAILGAWRTFSAVFSGDWETAWTEAKGVFAGIWDAIPGIIEGVFNGVFGVVDAAIQALINLVRTVFGDGVADAFRAVWDSVKIVFETARDTLLGVLGVFASLFKADWQAAWDGIKAIFSTIWSGITVLFEGPLNGITTFVTGWVATITGWFGNLKDQVLGFVTGMVEGIKEWFSETALGKTFGWIGDQIGTVTGWFYDMYDKVVGNSYVPDMVEEIGEAIQRLKDRLANPVARYTSEVIASFSDMEDDVVASMVSMAERMDEVLKGIVDRVAGFIGDVSRELWNGTATWTGVLDTFAGTIGSIFGSIFDAISKELVKNIITQNEWVIKTLANIATTITGFLSQAYATLVAFFAWSGPFAPALAGGVIAAAIAGIASIGGSIIRGLLPDAPGGGGGSSDLGGGGRPRSAGRQVSEITGPTRDLLTDLLTPLSSLNTLAGIGERIYNLLDDRLPMPGMQLAGLNATVGGVNVTVGPGAVQIIQSGGGATTPIDDETVEEIAQRLAEKIAFQLRGAGG